MPIYIVEVPEVHICYMAVEAENEQDAIMAVCNGNGEERGSDYQSTMGTDEYPWRAYLEDNV